MEAATVLCPSCGEANPAGKRFCGDCGSPLPVTCPSCGAENPPGKRFCGDCGSPLTGSAGPAAGTPTVGVVRERPLPEPPAQDIPPADGPALTAVREQASPPPSPGPKAHPQEERRLVTALFCDLVGFTPLSESLDLEEVRDIQSAYFGAMSAQIERYGGIVEKYAGDAVLALFGAPVAHEDDAERAVLCALGMQGAIEPVAEAARLRWEVEPAIRVGVNTGEVVSGTWAASGRQDVAVTGDAVNTAARIQSAAEPGEVLVGAETMRLTRRRIRYGEKRDLVLKGKLGTVPGYPAVGLREQFGERWEAHVTPLVGRDRELVQLLDAWMRVQGGEGQLVTLIGDAGVGKSRLMAELVEKVTASGAVRVVRARALSYGQEIGLWLVADLLRSLFGINERDGLAEVAGKLRAAMPGLLAGQAPDAQSEALDVLGEVLGLPPGGSTVAGAGAEIRRQALIRGLRLVLGAIGERTPSIVLLEDLHWIDEASGEVLTDVLSDVPGERLLVLAAQRPGWTAPWSEWGWTERMTLRALREEDAALLAGEVLGGMRLSPELQRHVAERAGGNPFFVEEMLRALEESGGLEERDGQMQLAPGAAERLPSTLTEVLLARLDRLEGQVRNLAQVASVIGRSFAVRLLAQVVERDAAALEMPLTQLQRAEIAFPRRGSDLEYVFKHVSMRDVAYNTLVQKRRQELHLQTARAIAALYPSDEYVEMIAYHYGRTEAPEAGEWLEKAGDRAAAIFANDSAIDHYREARRRVEMADAEPADLARLDEKLGGVLLTAGRNDEALEHLERAAARYREVHDLESAGRTTAQIGLGHRYRGTPEEGINRVRLMLDLLGWSGPSPGLAALYIALAQLTFLTGKYDEALTASERAADIARAIGDDRLLADAEERRGLNLSSLGHMERGAEVLRGSIGLAEAAGDLPVLRRGLLNLGDLCRRLGELEEARRLTERSLEVSDRIGNRYFDCFLLANLAEILLITGDWDEAREYDERALPLAADAGAWGANALCERGHMLLWQGDLEGARPALEHGLAIAESTGDYQMQLWVHRYLAELEVKEGRPQAARARLEPLIGKRDSSAGMLLSALAAACLELGDTDRAAESITEAVRRVREQMDRVELADALVVHARILIRQGDPDETRRVLDEGLELTRRIGYPYDEAQLLLEDAALRGATGDAEGGRRSLEEALAIFRRLGAKKDVEVAEAVEA